MMNTPKAPPQDLVLLYDGSFDGLLSAIFYSYRQHWQGITIASHITVSPNLLQDTFYVDTNIHHANRINQKIQQTVGKLGMQLLLNAFLTEKHDREALISQGIAVMLVNPSPQILQNFAEPTILQLHQWQKQIGRERHRWLAFVRFERMYNDIYLARIIPDFDILPLILKHFRQRYANQQWLIYDDNRSYGAYYNGKEIVWVNELEPEMLQNPQAYYHVNEQQFQTLWQSYFKNTNIVERTNMKQHLRCLPKRYWGYLSEKN